jgi:hypothetical protein
MILRQCEKIILIKNRKDILNIIIICMAKEGYEVVVAKNGETSRLSILFLLGNKKTTLNFVNSSISIAG